MPQVAQDENRRLREQIVVVDDDWVWQPAWPPYPPSVSLVLNGRLMENVRFVDGALANLPWPIQAGDVVSISYNAAPGSLPP